MHAAVNASVRAALEQPALLFLLCFVTSIFALRVARPSEDSKHRVAVLCGSVCILTFVALWLLNLSRLGFIWHDEASILSAAAAYVHGEPLYHSRSAPALYSLLYGPSTFLVYVPLLEASIQPLPLIRWANSAVLIADAILLYSILRSRVSAGIALALLAVPLAIMLSSASSAFGTRGDLVLLLCLCVAVLAVQLRSPLAAALLSGVLCGLAIDFKPTVLPEVLLLLALLHRRHRRAGLLLGALATLAASALPFLLPRISLASYWAWLVLSSHQGLLPRLLRDNLLAAALLLAPGLLLHRSARQRSAEPAWLAALFAVAVLSCILAGSKDGAGTWHLWPMLPFALLWTGHEAASASAGASSKQVPQIVAAIAIASMLVVLRLAYRDLGIVHAANLPAQRTAFRAAEQELAAIVQHHPGRNIEMGYGVDPGDYRSSLRFELPLQGEEFFLDENALVESIKAGNQPPSQLTDRILGCRDLWLIPHGDAPFQTLRKGVLPDTSSPYLFPDAIRLAFTASHALQSKGDYYDLWACRGAGLEGNESF